MYKRHTLPSVESNYFKLLKYNNYFNYNHVTVYQTYVGRRKHNEDSILFSSINICEGSKTRSYKIVGVADGAGGLGGGDLASTLTLQYLYIYSILWLIDNQPTEEALRRIILDINHRILEQIERVGRQIATTLSTILIDLENRKIYYANVGDTKIILFTKSNKKELSKQQRIYLDNGRTALTSYIGKPSLNNINVGSIKISTKSIISIMTDGVHEFIDDEEILDEVGMTDDLYRLNSAVKKLIMLAYNRGSSDNLTMSLTKLLPP